MPAPIRTGPKVSTDQYTRKRTISGRRRRTPQITLKVDSMVESMASTVTSSTVTPTACRLRALSLNSTR